MTAWKKSSELTKEELDEVAAFVASFASISPDLTPAEWLADPAVAKSKGYELFQNDCSGCHTLGSPAIPDERVQPAPDLFAWGSNRWTSRMIRHPGAANLYGYLKTKQVMPASEGQLTEADLGTLIRYLQGDYLARQVPTQGPESASAH